MIRQLVLTGTILAHLIGSTHAALDVKKLSDDDIKMVKSILETLTPVIQDKEKRAELAYLAFKDLEKPLSKSQRCFLKSFLALKPKQLGIKTTWRGLAEGKKDLVVISDQIITVKGKKRNLPPQYLPPTPYRAYEEMMAAMKKDLGKRLYVDSGYRSSAYQLFLFLYYLKNHNYSILETAEWNAFPGYSEHGAPKQQAIDFINEEGINGEDNPDDFARLPEFKWLQKNAYRFGYILSYPQSAGIGIAYEPWHWHFEGWLYAKNHALAGGTALKSPSKAK